MTKLTSSTVSEVSAMLVVRTILRTPRGGLLNTRRWSALLRVLCNGTSISLPFRNRAVEDSVVSAVLMSDIPGRKTKTAPLSAIGEMTFCTKSQMRSWFTRLSSIRLIDSCVRFEYSPYAAALSADSGGASMLISWCLRSALTSTCLLAWRDLRIAYGLSSSINVLLLSMASSR